jgi:pimeloyl-ACP methyl ester carboxylesterase
MAAPPPPSSNEWETSPTKSALVPIGTHSLFLSVSGPPRLPSPHPPHSLPPIILISPGSGETTTSYPPLSRLLTPFVRHLTYDRSGLGRSEDAPNPTSTSAVQSAVELSKLLEATGIAPPYVLVAHSYGAIIAREFLELRNSDVIGMVLAEGSTELQCKFFQIPDRAFITAVMGDLKFATVTGLRTESKLTRDEWRARAAEKPRGAVAMQAEADSFVAVSKTLEEKRQFERCVLGERPLSVVKARGVRDYEGIYQAGVEAGNGTEAERRAFGEVLEGWDRIDEGMKREQLRLSGRTRWVDVGDCGHNVQLTRPDVIAQEVRWVLRNLFEGGRGVGANM